MNSEVAWVLVSSETQVQPQIILDSDYLPDYLYVSCNYEQSTVSSSVKRFGRCVEDKLMRRIDISLESSVIKNEQVLPSHTKKEKHLVSGLAWDNFDINILTCLVQTLFITLMEFIIKI